MADEKQSCFVIMPITTPLNMLERYSGDENHFQHILEHLFLPAINELDFSLIPPSASGADIIHAEIIHNLETADLVLCDMSILNPNVFFELGIRTAVDKPVALVKDSITERVPFDTSLINHHTYNPTLTAWTLPEEIRSLTKHLQETIRRSKNRNSLWEYFGLTTRAELPADSSVDEKLGFIIQMLEDPLKSKAGHHPSLTSSTADKDTLAFTNLLDKMDVRYLFFGDTVLIADKGLNSKQKDILVEAAWANKVKIDWLR